VKKEPLDPRWRAAETIEIPHRRFESADAGQAAPAPLRDGDDLAQRPAAPRPLRTAIEGKANGMPPDRPYRYGQPRARWALDRLAQARAEYPEDEPRIGRPPKHSDEYREFTGTRIVRGQLRPAAPRPSIDPARVIAAMGEQAEDV
jgi:hypothetical protein